MHKGEVNDARASVMSCNRGGQACWLLPTSYVFCFCGTSTRTASCFQRCCDVYGVQRQPSGHPLLAHPALPVLQLVRPTVCLQSEQQLDLTYPAQLELCRYFHTLPFLLLRKGSACTTWQAVGLLVGIEVSVHWNSSQISKP